MDRFTPDMWFDVVGQYDLAECRQALASAARHMAFVAPADLIAEIKAARRAAMFADRRRPLDPAALPGAVAIREGLPDPRPLRDTIDEVLAANGWPKSE